MERIDPGMTVAEILKRHPEARPVLAGLGLDACCGGSHPLEFACRAHRIPLERVLAAIEEVSTPRPRLIDPEMTVREVIRRFPATLPVFDRHGLMGCGGSQGPVEPLGWFAQVHHVDLDGLVEELEEAAARVEPPAPVAAAVPSRSEIARENLYRRFLKAALLFTFTGGSLLGASALILMGLRGELGGIGRGLIQVHGHYQLFGWVGLFVIGVAYHILPRLTGVPLPSYRAASFSFVMLSAGTVLRTFQALDPSPLRSALLVAGALLELGGCLSFLWTIGKILMSQSGGWKPYQSYLAAGTVWLCVSALVNLAHASFLALRGEVEVPPWLNLPFLTLFLVGFVTFWILGVSLRTLPVFMGLRTRPVISSALPVPLSASVLLLAAGEGMIVAGGPQAGRILFGIGGFGTAACLALFTWALGILGPSGEAEPGLDRGYEKFLRLGYAWLLISGLMLAAFSVLSVTGRSMDHALAGAYRHAITVGFITTVMVGMASRIVPVFRGVPLYSRLLLEITFWLLAVGNLIRVLFQSLSAFGGPVWLRMSPVSGVLELVGLLLFGVNLWKTLDAATEEESAAARVPPPLAGDTLVGDVLAADPALLPVFLGAGFTPLANPVLRRTLAKGVSIAQACRMHGVDIQEFLGRLAEARGRLRT